MSIYISGYPSVLQVCLLAVQPGLLARLAMHLAMHPAIWLSCISIHLHIWQSGNLAVHSSASARICLPFCPAILFCHSVLPACSAGCASVACLNAYLPLSECLHCCSSIWLLFCSSVNLVICRSVLLPAGCNFVHLPVPQARYQSVSSSANPGRP